jgi:hypothetical protein
LIEITHKVVSSTVQIIIPSKQTGKSREIEEKRI